MTLYSTRQYLYPCMVSLKNFGLKVANSATCVWQSHSEVQCFHQEVFMVLGWSVMNFGLKYHSYAILFLLIMICSFLLGCLSCKPLFVEGKLKNNCQSYCSFQRPVIWSLTSSCAICHLLSLFFLAIKAFLIEMITKWWLSNTKAWNISLDA